MKNIIALKVIIEPIAKFTYAIVLCSLIIIGTVSINTNYALATEPIQCPMSDEELNAKIFTYLNNIKKVAVEFTQTDTRGTSASGMLIIDKPYKFRCNYYQPFPLLIIGNKSYVSVYDYEMENFTRIKNEENVFNFLLLEEAAFNHQFQIISNKEYKDYNELTLYHEKSGRVSKILFDTKNGQIKKIIIVENDNEITIKFLEIRNLISVAKELFIIQDPEIFGKPKRLDKKEIEKMIK